MLALTPETILSAYAQGAFPMADDVGVIRWYTADPRGVLPLDQFRTPRSLRQVIRRGVFEVRYNTSFPAVMAGCRQNRTEGSWISPELIELYTRLHDMGFAHSVECWQTGRLVGGLYGVALGAAFFGESMFYTVSNASKVALAFLVDRLRERDFRLLDTQAVTQHLSQFGCVELPSRQYLKLLQAALPLQRSFD